MRILVLGSTGFLGRLLVEELRRGEHVVACWARTAEERPDLGSRRVDLSGTHDLPVPDAPWDAAVLLAGPSVPARFRAPIEGAETVRIAERALVHLARHARGARVIVVSSAHVLTPALDAIDENALVSPSGDYGAAKAAVEGLARSFVGDLDVIVARLFGSLGPDLPRGLFVPDLLERLRRRESPVRLAGPDAVRDLTDGRDVARALRGLLMMPRGTEGTFHVGTGRALRLSDLAQRLAREIGAASQVEFAPGEGPAWIADAARLRARIGWIPHHELDATIAWTARGSELASRAAP